MAIVSKPKRNAHYKKTQAAHHRHSRNYLKSYWPYLPMLAIMGGGIAVDRAWTVTNSQAGLGALNTLEGTSRLQSLTGNHAAWLAGFVLVLTIGALAFFMIGRAYAIHKAVIKGEHFISKHPLLDIAAVLIFTAGFVLAG